MDGTFTNDLTNSTSSAYTSLKTELENHIMINGGINVLSATVTNFTQGSIIASVDVVVDSIYNTTYATTLLENNLSNTTLSTSNYNLTLVVIQATTQVATSTPSITTTPVATATVITATTPDVTTPVVTPTQGATPTLVTITTVAATAPSVATTTPPASTVTTPVATVSNPVATVTTPVVLPPVGTSTGTTAPVATAAETVITATQTVATVTASVATATETVVTATASVADVTTTPAVVTTTPAVVTSTPAVVTTTPVVVVTTTPLIFTTAPAIAPTGTALSYGIAEGDTEMDRNTQFGSFLYYKDIPVNNVLPLADSNVQIASLVITTVGTVQLLPASSTVYVHPLLSWRPVPFDTIVANGRQREANSVGFYMFAPFWADTYTFPGDSSTVYYSVFTDTSNTTGARAAFAFGNDIVRSNTNFIDFNTDFMVKVTWVNMLAPDFDFNRRVTVQMLFMVDTKLSRSYVEYIYPEVNWVNTGRYINIGLHMQTPTCAVNEQSIFSNLPGALSAATNIVDTYFNPQLGANGVMLMTTTCENTNIINYHANCVNWALPQLEQNTNNQSAPACPCNGIQAFFDPRWFTYSFDPANRRRCFVQLFPFPSRSTRVCCYEWFGSNFGFGLITSINTNLTNANSGMVTQHTGMFRYHPWYFRAQWEIEDQPYFDTCCVKSNLCNLYQQVRPINNCTGYIPPIFGWMIGDPHIITLDGKSYTFNGLGEYVLITSANPGFELQARTERAIDSSGNLQQATVFSVITCKDLNGDRAQVEINADRNGIVVYMNDIDVTSSFFDPAAVDQTTLSDYREVTLIKKSNVSAQLSFTSGMSVTITFGEGQLYISAAATSDFRGTTSGLLGVFNGDQSDDFTLRNGSTISIDSPETVIYDDFGNNWRVTEAESIIYYHGNATWASMNVTGASFTPYFLETMQSVLNIPDTVWNGYNTTCNGEKTCIFDTAVTGSDTFGQLTLTNNENSLQVSTDMANTPPEIVVPDASLNVIVGQLATLTGLEATDNDVADSATLSANFKVLSDGSEVSGYLFNGSVLTWTPADATPVLLVLTAMDTRNASAPEKPISIRLCDCNSSGGTCDFTTLRSGQDSESTFLLVTCVCNVGYTGLSCSEDINGCANNPCGCAANTAPAQCTGGNSICTDVAAVDDTTGGDYSCSACNPGYEKRNMSDAAHSDCVDINECNSTTTPDNCDPTYGSCTNNEGSFTCSCQSGFRLSTDLANCTDIDECTELTANCQQNCTNTVGSFNCTCFSGSTLNADGITCTLDASLEANCNTTGCENCRRNTSDSNAVECFCPAGYMLNNDGTSCSDIDECNSNLDNNCDLSTSNCSNTQGSYECSCFDGYGRQSDLRTCTACQVGFWGSGCTNVCGCTNCNATTGCITCDNPGFTGATCMVDVDECLHTSPCGSNTVNCTNTMGSFRCNCQDGYTAANATFCEDLNDCLSMPCLHAGTCTNQNGPSYTCSCVDGYTGNNCENETLECASNPCQNGATCSELVNQYRCICNGLYTGIHCEIPPTDQCGHSGTNCGILGNCTNLNNTHYQCSCPSTSVAPNQNCPARGIVVGGFVITAGVTWSTDLSNSTAAYTNLKTAVESMFTANFSCPDCKILDIFFREGSSSTVVSVSFLMSILSASNENTIGETVFNTTVSAVSGYTITRSTVLFGTYSAPLLSAAGTVIASVDLAAQFTITSGQTYSSDLADQTSSSYLELQSLTSSWMQNICTQRGVDCSVRGTTFTSGSIVTDYTLRVPTGTNIEQIVLTMVAKANDGSFTTGSSGYVVDGNTILLGTVNQTNVFQNVAGNVTLTGVSFATQTEAVWKALLSQWFDDWCRSDSDIPMIYCQLLNSTVDSGSFAFSFTLAIGSSLDVTAVGTAWYNAALMNTGFANTTYQFESFFLGAPIDRCAAAGVDCGIGTCDSLNFTDYQCTCPTTPNIAVSTNCPARDVVSGSFDITAGTTWSSVLNDSNSINYTSLRDDIQSLFKNNFSCPDCEVTSMVFQEGSPSGVITVSFIMSILATSNETVIAVALYDTAAAPVGGYTIANATIVFGTYSAPVAPPTGVVSIDITGQFTITSGESYVSALSDNSTSEYLNLRVLVVKWLKDLCTLRGVSCTVLNVGFTSGSIITDYTLRILNNSDQEQLALTLVALASNNTFTHDPNYVVNGGSVILGTYNPVTLFQNATGGARIYNKNFGNQNSTAWANEITTWFDDWCRSDTVIPMIYCEARDMVATSGSVLFTFSLTMGKSLNVRDVLYAWRDATLNNGFANTTYKFDRFTLGEHTISDGLTTGQIVGIAVGVTLALIAIIIIAVIVMCIIQRRDNARSASGKSSRGDEDSSISGSSFSPLGFPGGVRPGKLMWHADGTLQRVSQEPGRLYDNAYRHMPRYGPSYSGREYPESSYVPGSNNYDYEAGRMQNIQEAVHRTPQIDWSVIRNFSRRNQEGQHGGQFAQLWRNSQQSDWGWEESKTPKVHRRTPPYMPGGEGSLEGMAVMDTTSYVSSDEEI